MKRSLRAGICSAFFSVVLSSSAAFAQSSPPSAGNAAFAAGNFDAAAAAYTAALTKNPDDPDAELGIGTVELYRNHLDAARGHLQRALALAPNSPRARMRLDSIEKRTGGPTDFQIAFASPQARVALTAVDPLPTLHATINGVPATFAIDTGGGNLDISESLVNRLHLSTSVVGEGIFAGGRRAQLRSVRIDRLDFPGVTVRGIPGGVMPGGPPGIDGIIGTSFLYHFLATIDYGQRMLVLRPTADSAAFLASAKAAGATAVPMWLAGDHFLFARARVNAAPDALYSIDTGGPGVGVDLTTSSLAAAGITPDASHPQSMVGGGGATQFLPFTAASVTIGNFTLHDLPGIYVPSGGLDGVFPFAVAGRISHEFFRHTALTFDFSTMTLVLTPARG
jgi:tetratricopeptide (TPR) repeat protein